MENMDQWLVVPIEARHRQFQIASLVEVESRVQFSLDELAQLCGDLEDDEAALELTAADVRRLLIVGFVEDEGSQQLKNMAAVLGVRITPKDFQRGEKQVRARLIHELEKPSVREKMTHRATTIFVGQELREKVAAGPATDAGDVASQMIRSLMDVERMPYDIPAAMAEQMQVDTMMTVAAFVSEEAVRLWGDWVRDSGWTNGQSLFLAVLWRKLELWLGYHQKRTKSDAEQPVASVNYKALYEELKATYEADMREMWAVLERQRKRVSQDDNDAQPSDTASLDGLRILVVGDDSHAVGYRALVEEAGARFDFLPGFERDGQAAVKMASADGILFVTAYANHLKYYAVKAYVDMRRAVMVDRAGLSAFQTKLRELGRKLELSVQAQ